MITLALLNGGLGKRVGSDMPKQLIRLQGVPIFIYSLRIADEIDEISSVVINFPVGWKDKIKSIIDKYAIRTPITYVEAGITRQDSVRKILKAVKTSKILIHEAARPFVCADDFKSLINLPDNNITYTLPISYTVLQGDPEKKHINALLDRSLLLNIQLPQKFNTAELRKAHEKAYKENLFYTEDASIVFANGGSVTYIKGDEGNFKITNQIDIKRAEIMMQADTSGTLS